MQIHHDIRCAKPRRLLRRMLLYRDVRLAMPLRALSEPAVQRRLRGVAYLPTTTLPEMLPCPGLPATFPTSRRVTQPGKFYSDEHEMLCPPVWYRRCAANPHGYFYGGKAGDITHVKPQQQRQQRQEEY